MLSPNALRILDDLGVYERIRNKGFSFEALTFKSESGETTGKYFFGHEKLYGYQGLRIYRQVLIDQLLAMLQERHIAVHYEKKFPRVLLEGDDYVCLEFADGSTERADL
jgi:2-polyprenyl-6-methoxyphenol hydroxylase-like FAD-dependent oxidoreductase